MLVAKRKIILGDTDITEVGAVFNTNDKELEERLIKNGSLEKIKEKKGSHGSRSKR